MKKSNKKGFTLVELVVVIAIIGILAAILVPTMMNYVKKAKLKSANSNAKLVFTTVNSQIADLIVEDKVSDIKGSGAVKKISALASGGTIEKAVYEALKGNGSNAGSCCWKVDANDVTVAQWAGSDVAGSIVGQYPDPENNVADAESHTLGKLVSDDNTAAFN